LSSDEALAPGSAPALEFRLLGPVQATVDGVLADLGGSKPSGLLAVLLLAANSPVSTSELIDALWWEAPRSASKMIQMHVSRIRQQLGVRSECLRTVPRGYLIEVGPAELDLSRVADLTARGRAAAAEDPQLASRLLTEALALFRGPALATVRDEPFATASVMRLDELRVDLLEERIDADLAAGRGRELVGELQGLVAVYPSREHMGGQLMLSLYQSDRQTEALAAARALRERLAEDLGISPSPAIERLETAILNHDPALSLTAPPAPSRDIASATSDDRLKSAEPQQAPNEPPRRPRRRRTVIATAVAGMLVVAGLGAVLTTTLTPAKSRTSTETGTSTPVGTIGPASLVVVDGRTDSVRADLPLGGQPDQVSVADDAAFVGNLARRTLTQIDLVDDKQGPTYGLPLRPAVLAATTDDVWIGDGFSGQVSWLSRPAQALIGPEFPAERSAGLLALAADDKLLWAGLPDGRLVAVRPASLAVAVEKQLSGGRVQLLADDGDVVCAGYFRTAAVDCLRPADESIIASMALPAPAHAVAVGPGGAWALAGAPARLFHLTVRPGAKATSQRIPPGATGLAVSDSYLWVLYRDRGRLLRLPLSGGGPSVTLDLGRPATALGTWGDQVLVTTK
jgi:DNA-binding SARP family transcriptional activator